MCSKRIKYLQKIKKIKRQAILIQLIKKIKRQAILIQLIEKNLIYYINSQHDTF